MIVSSVARAGLVAETRRVEAVQDTTQNSNDTASLAQAVQQQAAASQDAQFTRAPEETAGLRFSAVLGAYTGTGDEAEAPSETDAGSENNLLARSVVVRNNATLQEQIAERVRQVYDLT